MSRFVTQVQIGDPIALELVDRDIPHPGPGEVRVRVAAAGLNPIDWKLAALPELASAFGISVPTGFGNDFAGVVDELGPDVTGVAVGDRVFGGARSRALAEHIVIEAGALHRTPDGLDDERASALDIAGRTADATVRTAGVGDGDTVLIGGAAGGVGVFAVQLAIAAGATVIATASDGNHAFLRELGAIPTAYGDGLADRVRALAPNGVDAAIDLQGTETVTAALELGVAPARIATIAAGPTPPGGAVPTNSSEAAPDALERIAAAIADGRVVLPIAATFPIERIADAVALQRTGHVRGKVVVTV